MAVYAAVFLYFLIPRSDEFWSASLFYPLLVGVIVATIIIRRRTTRESRPEHMQPVDPSVAGYLRKRAVIVEVLMLRASAEHAVQMNAAKFHEGAWRQYLNAELRNLGIWEDLEPKEKDLLAAPEGRWSEQQICNLPEWAEQGRLLRWVLRLNDALTPLDRVPTSKAAPGFDEVLAGKAELLGSSDVRVERDNAGLYALRILGECEYRTPSAAEPIEGALELRNRIAGTSQGLMAGWGTVEEMDDDRLRELGATSFARWEYASYLVDQLSESRPISFETWRETEHNSGEAKG